MKVILAFMGAAALVSAGLVSPAHGAASASSATGQVTVVQAVPRAEVDVTIDGELVERSVATGSLVGPVSLSPGEHELVFSGVPGSPPIKTSVSTGAGSSSDVVLHLPAAVNGAPVVNTYRTPQSPIGPGKARLLLAHTATVPPADVKIDGKVVFTNIANGEFADADVPAGSHRVSLLATGTTTDPILGPLTVDLAARTATMVYAVGNPRNGSMNVIAHTVELAADGSTVPQTMDTGSAGLVAGAPVTPFSALPAAESPAPRAIAGPRDGGDRLVWFAGAGGLLLVAMTSRARRRSAVRCPVRSGPPILRQ